MATLYITEFAELAGANFGKDAAAPKCPPLVEQTVAIGGSSTACVGFNPSTHLVLIHTDAICSIAFGTNPVAVATAHRMAANETRFYGVTPGQQIAVITNT